MLHQDSLSQIRPWEALHSEDVEGIETFFRRQPPDDGSGFKSTFQPKYYVRVVPAVLSNPNSSIEPLNFTALLNITLSPNRASFPLYLCPWANSKGVWFPPLSGTRNLFSNHAACLKLHGNRWLFPAIAILGPDGGSQSSDRLNGPLCQTNWGMWACGDYANSGAQSHHFPHLLYCPQDLPRGPLSICFPEMHSQYRTSSTTILKLAVALLGTGTANTASEWGMSHFDPVSPSLVLCLPPSFQHSSHPHPVYVNANSNAITHFPRSSFSSLLWCLLVATHAWHQGAYGRWVTKCNLLLQAW